MKCESSRIGSQDSSAVTLDSTEWFTCQIRWSFSFILFFENHNLLIKWSIEEISSCGTTNSRKHCIMHAPYVHKPHQSSQRVRSIAFFPMSLSLACLLALSLSIARIIVNKEEIRVSLKCFLGRYKQTLPLIRPGRSMNKRVSERMLHECI